MTETPRKGRRILFALLPLALFLGLAGLFLARLGVDSSRLPSALVGRPAPAFTLPALAGIDSPGLSDADMKGGGVTLLNVFASWCAPCREEHPLLMRIAQDEKLKARGVRLVGLNYKDKPSNALDFLTRLGNPYSRVGVDRAGRAAIDWGVYGVPETFVIGPGGEILYRYVGALTEEGLRDRLMPAIEKGLAKS